MKRFILLIMVPIAVMAATAHQASAQDRTRTFADKVTGGSLTVTNTYGERSALELERVAFTIPVATFTNTFTIKHIVRMRLPDTIVNQVVTNNVTDADGNYIVSTNILYQSGGTHEFTNIYTVAVTTNETGCQYYDRDDFGDGFEFMNSDIAVFGFTYTGAIYVIRDYSEHIRP